jgi:ATP-binding cassette subfamily C exporter for protease/lipase
LARALYGDPSLIVLDEPNSNLDEAGELALLAAINDLRNRHKTTVIVTHRRSILETATKLLYLREGATIFGSKEQVKRELARLSQRLVQKAEHEEEHSA